MPELVEEPPTQSEAPASLKALFQIPSALVEPEEIPEVEPEKPPVKPAVDPESPASKKLAEAANPEVVKPESRLAPDFDATKKAAAPEPEIEITDEMIAAAKTPKAQADMKQFRDRYNALKTEVETLRNKPAAAPEDTGIKTLYEKVKQERDTLLERIERTNLYESPKFQQEHLIPRQKQFDRLSGIVKESGGNPEALQRAISLTGKGRIEALDEIRGAIESDMLKGQFDRLVEDIDSRTSEINEKVRNAKQTSAELQKAELLTREQQHAKLAKEYEGLLSHAHRDMAENIAPELFTKVDDPNYAWWNEAIDRDDQVAREILLDATPQKVAFAAKFASKFGTVLHMWRAERAANKAKDEEIAALKDAEPTLMAERAQIKIDSEKADSESIRERLRAGAYRK